MKRKYTLEACLVDIPAATSGSPAAAALAQTIQRKRFYKDSQIRAALWAHDDPDFRRIAKEADLLCAIENDLLAEIKTISAGFDWVGSEFVHTLLALESLHRIRLQLPGCPVLPLQIEERDLDGVQHQSIFDSLAGWDYFLEYFGVVLKDLMTRCESPAIVPNISLEKFNKATRHFFQATKWQIFFESRSFWEQGELAIDTEEMVLDAGHSELVRAFRISLSRVRAFRASHSAKRFGDESVFPGTREMPLDAFRSTDEMTSCYLTTLQFFSSDLKEVVHGASLAEWIRAYHVLRDFARATLQEVVADEPRKLLVEQSPTFFQMLLNKQGGINQRRAEAIVKHLTFGSTSKDLLDCPLVPFGQRLLMLPAITAILEPAHSLESMLHSVRSEKNHEVQFIGPGLESSVRASIQKGGRLVRKIVHGNVDCDAAFVLDDVLFLCECKGKFIAADFNTYAEWEHHLRTEVVKQHRRTCDFFAKHLNLVRSKLKLEPNWQPKAIERVIITSAKLGRSMKIDGYWITDHHTVHAYFTRRQAKILIGSQEKFELADERLQGPLTAQGFLDYLSDPQVISIHQDYVAQRNIPLEVGGRDISFKDCQTYGEVQFLDER